MPFGNGGGSAQRSDGVSQLQGQERHDGRQVPHPPLQGARPPDAKEERQGGSGGL